MFDKTVIEKHNKQSAYFSLTDKAWDRLGLKNDFNLFPFQRFVRIPFVGESIYIRNDLLVVPKFEPFIRDHAIGRIVMDKQFVKIVDVYHDGYATTVSLTISLPENARFIDHV